MTTLRLAEPAASEQSIQSHLAVGLKDEDRLVFYSLSDPSQKEDLVIRSFTISNEAEQPVAWRLKGNRSDLFAARPLRGILRPGQSAEINVYLEPRGALDKAGVFEKKSVRKAAFLLQSVGVIVDGTPDDADLSAMLNAANAQHYPEFQQFRFGERKVKARVIDANAAATVSIEKKKAPEKPQQQPQTQTKSEAKPEAKPEAPQPATIPTEISPILKAQQKTSTSSQHSDRSTSSKISLGSQSSATAPSVEAEAEAQKKYDELLGYTVKLEEEVDQLKQDATELRRRVQIATEAKETLVQQLTQSEARVQQLEVSNAALEKRAGSRMMLQEDRAASLSDLFALRLDGQTPLWRQPLALAVAAILFAYVLGRLGV